jgi:hypothetical protein
MFLDHLIGGQAAAMPMTPARPVVDTLESRTLMTVVLPGNFVITHGTTAAARPELAGTVIHDTLIPLSIKDSGGVVIFKGHLQDRVVRETKAGTLDFYQDIRADAGWKLDVLLEDVEHSSFKGSTTDVDYRTDGIGDPSVHPVLATRDNGAGPVVSFFFNGETLEVGKDSLFFFVKTDARTYDLKGSTSIEVKSLQAPTGAPGVFGPEVVTTAEPTQLAVVTPLFGRK